MLRIAVCVVIGVAIVVGFFALAMDGNEVGESRPPASLTEKQEVYDLTYSMYADEFPRASDEWLDCVADLLSERYPTLEEAGALMNDAENEAFSDEMLDACGLEGSGEF